MNISGQDFSVLGADGYVGRALCQYLSTRGARVRAMGRGEVEDVSQPLGHAIYCIGMTADYAKRPFDTVEAHVGLFSRLLQNATFESLTYLSSTRLYDSGMDGRETAPLTLAPHNPRHLYDLSKALGESLCLTAGRANVRTARLANVYDDSLVSENFLHDLLRRALREPAIRLASHPRAARDYVHLDDICAALAAIALSGRRQIYNVASGRNVANADLFAAIEKLIGCSISTTVAADAPYTAPPTIDVSALAEDLALRPRALQDALPGMIARQRSASAITK